MQSKNPTLSAPRPDTNHETFDWRVAPVLLEDACCTNPKCGTYHQPDLSRLQFQTRPSYPVQVQCQECHQTWNSVNALFRQISPIHSEISGVFVTLGSLAALPYMPWSQPIRYGAAGALVLAQLQLWGKLHQRAQRRRAYQLFAQLTNTAPFFHDPVNLDALQQRLTKLPHRFDQELHRSLLAFTKALRERGLSQLSLLQQALLLHNQEAYPRLQRQLRKATVKPKEKESVQKLLQLLQQIKEDPDNWIKLPQLLQDILDSLEQDLADWPQSPKEEAKEIFENIQTLHREGQEILQRLTQHP